MISVRFLIDLRQVCVEVDYTLCKELCIFILHVLWLALFVHLVRIIGTVNLECIESKSCRAIDL